MATYRRYLPRTLLPLDRWAQIVGIDPRHFRQVTTDEKVVQNCSNVWLQYSWQQNDQLGRHDVANAIQQAEKTFAQYLGYKLLPTWEYDEIKQTPKMGNPDIFNYGGIDVRGYRMSVKANWGHFVEAGVETKSLIEAGVAVVLSDVDGDGYNETATITVATSVTDEEEIALFYPSEGGADEWEIRPFRNITISGGNAVITLWKHQLVLPDLIEAIAPQAVDGDTDANFLTTVDVYRRYNDSTTQATLVWNPNLNNCSCSSTGCCPVCSYTEQDACLMAKDYETSWLSYKPATYDEDDGWTSASLTCGRNPDRVNIYYRAGLQDKKRTYPMLEMDPQWERAVAYYSLTLLDRDMCGCDPLKSLYFKMKEDMSKGGINATNRQLENPLGTTRGAWYAWNMLTEPNRVEGQPVRW